jgi:hypothetical protein
MGMMEERPGCLDLHAKSVKRELCSPFSARVDGRQLKLPPTPNAQLSDARSAIERFRPFTGLEKQAGLLLAPESFFDELGYEDTLFVVSFVSSTRYRKPRLRGRWFFSQPMDVGQIGHCHIRKSCRRQQVSDRLHSIPVHCRQRLTGAVCVVPREELITFARFLLREPESIDHHNPTLWRQEPSPVHERNLRFAQRP